MACSVANRDELAMNAKQLLSLFTEVPRRGILGSSAIAVVLVPWGQPLWWETWGEGVQGMYVLQIEHPIRDFETWKAAFERFSDKRRQSGVRRHQIFQPADDEN